MRFCLMSILAKVFFAAKRVEASEERVEASEERVEASEERDDAADERDLWEEAVSFALRRLTPTPRRRRRRRDRRGDFFLILGVLRKD